MIIRTAVAATGATAGWLMALEGEALRVAAAAGGEEASMLLARTVPAGLGAAGFVAASGQPLAVSRGGDARFAEGISSLLGRPPASILAVPCLADDVVIGVMELVDKAAGGNFSFDDLELATMLAGIAGVGMASAADQLPAVPPPAQLSGDLARLASADPARYAGVASAVAALLGG